MPILLWLVVLGGGGILGAKALRKHAAQPAPKGVTAAPPNEFGTDGPVPPPEVFVQYREQREGVAPRNVQPEPVERPDRFRRAPQTGDDDAAMPGTEAAPHPRPLEGAALTAALRAEVRDQIAGTTPAPELAEPKRPDEPVLNFPVPTASAPAIPGSIAPPPKNISTPIFSPAPRAVES